MRLVLAGVSIALAGLAAAAFGPLHRTAPARTSTLDRFAWLAGCFEMKQGSLMVEEHRMATRAGTMLGMSRTTSEKGLVEYELTLLREGNGTLVYEAHPSGQPAAAFPATVLAPDSILFADPGHDYPQTIGYRRVGRDSVMAWIDGVSRENSGESSFPIGGWPVPARHEPRQSRTTTVATSSLGANPGPPEKQPRITWNPGPSPGTRNVPSPRWLSS